MRFRNKKLGTRLHNKSKHEGIRYLCKHCDYVATQQGNLKSHVKRKHEEQLCNKTIIKAKGEHVKVMIKKVDLSKYPKHPKSSEPNKIKISGKEKVNTNTKIEKIEDIPSISNTYSSS